MNSTPQTRLFIQGEFVPASSGRRFQNTNPINGTLVSEVHEASRADVDAAVKAAQAALRGDWGRMAVEARTAMLHAVANEIARRFDDFLQAEIADTGKPRSIAGHIDIPRGAANFKTFADIVKNVPTESFHLDTPDGRGALNYGVRVPKGVIGVISPWNLPLLLMTWKVGPALACGNTVVVKPSEETPSTATLLGEVMNSVGVPAGVYNVVHGFGPDSAGEWLTQHPDVNAITFTGETRTGEAIMRAAAKGVRPVSFELGGKNAGVVFADADFEAAVDGISRSAFANTGQVCLGTERVYVERSIFDRFTQALKKKAEGFVFGDPMDPATTMGPVVSREHHEKVLGYFAQAREQGAQIVAGGGIPQLPAHYQNGYWVQPTIWTGLPPESNVLTEEIFGPCVHLQPFDTEEEAITQANNSPYGLATTIWTQDLSRAHRVAGKINVGITWINCWFLRDLRTSFGGQGLSGIGREGGVHSLEFYTELRNVCVKL
ncbi:2-hydroxymuconic semialdehyde dehydrogenase [Hydrogenophaga sp.]|uniref:2-hydroxymuconic semialdehyde dehydrogenase n=1 Tax=Hydrogenophaga sp. TaxID=1904254 RepID=UPI0035697642